MFNIDFQLCQFCFGEIHFTCTDYLAASFSAPLKARQRRHGGVVECFCCCWGSVWFSPLREIIGDIHAWHILSLWSILKYWKEKENRIFPLTIFYSSYCYDKNTWGNNLGVEGVLSVHDGEGMAVGVRGCLFTVGISGKSGDQEQRCHESLSHFLT